MFRIDADGNVSTLPSPDALGTEGYWSRGDPGTGQAATVLDQDWFNAAQENLIALLTAGGIAHSKTDYSRLWQSLFRAFSFQDVGAANALSVALPAGLTFPAGSLGLGTTVRVKVAAGNTGASTLTLFGLTALPILRAAGAACVGGELIEGRFAELVHDGAGNWQLLSPTPPILYIDNYGSTFSGNWTARTGVTSIDVELWGGGGAGGGSQNAGDAGAGGGGGEYRRGTFIVAPDSTVALNLPAVAVGGGSIGNNGQNAGTAVFGALMTAAGGGGGGGSAGGGISTSPGAGGVAGGGGAFAIGGDVGDIAFFLINSARGQGQGGAAFQGPRPGIAVSSDVSPSFGLHGGFPGAGGNGGANGGDGGNGGPAYCIVRSWAA